MRAAAESAPQSQPPPQRLKEVLVVGGGTAGWLAACHLARKLKGGVKVRLIESPDIPTIGVGEGTVPAIRLSLEHLGISETDFIRDCDAAFKQGIKFVGWMAAPNHGYHHVFDYPRREPVDITPYWLLQGREQAYADWAGIQAGVCDAGLAPKQITQPEYAGFANYAYHLNAAKFADLLMRHATAALGVAHLKANVTGVLMDGRGDIAHVETDRCGRLAADFFVDCTGFASKLLGGALGVPFIDRGDTLLADSAVVAQAPYPAPDAPIPSYTIAAARAAGWIWDIGLASRRGTGYVYSSKHVSHEDAEAELRAYLADTGGDGAGGGGAGGKKGAAGAGSGGEGAGEIPLRRISFKVGYREQFWCRNCAAIGLAQGFVEPLEATGLLMFDATARMLAEQFPARRELMPLLAKRFNQRVRFAWERVIDFIKLHYCISDRNDSAFWRDNRDPATIPDSLRENLELWRHQVPSEYDFSSRLEIFNLENYLYVLYGMQFPTDIAPVAYRYAESAKARAAVADTRALAAEARAVLPPHRELLGKIRKYGLQKV